MPKERPVETTGATVKIPAGCGTMYITLGYVDNQLFEIFAWLGKGGSCAKSMVEAIVRCIAIGLQEGIPVEAYIEHLENISCPTHAMRKGGAVTSCADAIAKVLKEHTMKKEKDTSAL